MSDGNWHKVKQGEWLNKIAVQYNVDAQTIWNHAANANLAKIRDKNILFPGDILFIPAIQKKTEGGVSTRTNSHKLGPDQTDTFHLRLLNADGSPLAGKKYLLDLGDQKFSGTTDGDGVLHVHKINPQGHHVGTLELSEIGIKYDICLGHLNPINQTKLGDPKEYDDGVSGVQMRLCNMGFDPGPLDGIQGPRTSNAIKRFQIEQMHRSADKATGELDPETRGAIKSKHDSLSSSLTSGKDASFKVYFTWSESDLAQGNNLLISCDFEDIPSQSQMKSGLMGFTRGEAENIFYGDAPKKAAFSLNTNQTHRLQSGQFLYMDVGCWLDGKQTFGLVWKDQAIVCEYGALGKTQQANSEDGNLLDLFMNSCPKVSPARKIDKKKILGPFSPDPNVLYLVLPDMHIPETSYYDLFGSCQSIAGMTEFLTMVSKLKWAKEKIHVIQVGDMYELWANRDLFLEETKEDDPGIRISSTPTKYKESLLLHPWDRSKRMVMETTAEVEQALGFQSVPTVVDSHRIIGEWIGRTHVSNPELFNAFDEVKHKCKDFSVLYGNHDSYLFDDGVVQAANQYIEKNSLDSENLSSTVFSGNMSLWLPGTFIEHGQRFDPANRDGSTTGYGFATKAAQSDAIKSIKDYFDPIIRKTCVAGAAAHWVSVSNNFGLYVQGHTHTPELKYVEVFHRLKDSQLVISPQGNKHG